MFLDVVLIFQRIRLKDLIISFSNFNQYKINNKSNFVMIYETGNKLLIRLTFQFSARLFKV